MAGDLDRRQVLSRGLTLGLATTTLGCGRLELFGPLWRAPEGPFRAPPERLDGEIDLALHVLRRLSFGPRPEDLGRLLDSAPSTGRAITHFIEEQLRPEAIDDRACDRVVRRLETLIEPLGELFEYKEEVLLDQLGRAAILRAVYSRRQLYEQMVQFWTDHFNIDPSKGDCRWLKVADDRDVIRRHALGRFPDLLRASALSPAMLWYLDGRSNRRTDTAGAGPNENYARELLELHTLGVDGGYDQRDVMEVARCLTGWTVRSRAGSEPTSFGRGRVEFRAARHDDGPKTVLGRPIPAGLGAKNLDAVLDIVALHPSTCQHLATKLCRRFISDDPPSAAVSQVARAFADSAGDIASTLRTLFATNAFLETRRNKLARPFRFVVSALRASGARTDGGEPILRHLLSMGHGPFRYPTPDGYPEEAGPWYGTLLWRLAFATSLASGRLEGTEVELAELARGFGPGTSGGQALERHLLGRAPHPEERRVLDAESRSSAERLALVLGGPTFQRY